MELDINVNSSSVAEGVLGLVKGYAKNAQVDLAFLLEGHNEEELPEEVITSFRLINPNLRGAKNMGPDPDPETTKRNLEAEQK